MYLVEKEMVTSKSGRGLTFQRTVFLNFLFLQINFFFTCTHCTLSITFNLYLSTLLLYLFSISFFFFLSLTLCLWIYVTSFNRWVLIIYYYLDIKPPCYLDDINDWVKAKEVLWLLRYIMSRLYCWKYIV